MAWKRMVLEIGMGTDIRGTDPTKAAVRALRDALWRNSLTVAGALGRSSDEMRVEVTIGVPRPHEVDHAAVLAVLPHGTGVLSVVEGGLMIANEAGTDGTLIGPGEIPGLPRHGVGRSCKVGKEEVVGLLAALDLFAAEGVASDTARWTSLASRLAARLDAVDGLDATFVAASYRPGIPGVRLRFAADPVRRAAALTRFLRDRDPPVFLDQERLDDGDLGITTICLRDEDVDAIVAAVSDFAGGAATDRG